MYIKSSPSLLVLSDKQHQALVIFLFFCLYLQPLWENNYEKGIKLKKMDNVSNVNTKIFLISYTVI